MGGAQKLVVRSAIAALVVASSAWAAGSFGEVIHVKGSSLLRDVACLPHSCVAVGTAGQNESGVVEKVNGKLTKVPGTFGLTQVDCPGQTTCYAVGETFSQKKGPQGVLVTIKNGAPTGVQTSADNMNAIACGTSSSCWVPGNIARRNAAPTESLLSHVVNGKVVSVIQVAKYPYLFSAGETSSTPACFGDHCIFAGKLSDTGPGELFELARGKVSRLATVSQATAVAGLACFTPDNCRLAGYKTTKTGEDAVIATWHNGKLGHVHTLTNMGVGPLACLTNMRCFAFGGTIGGTSSHAELFTINSAGDLVDTRTIEPFIDGVFCSHTCLAAGSVGQFPSGGGVLFDKFVH